MAQNFKPIFDYLDEMKSGLTEEIIEAVDIRLGKIQTTLDTIITDHKNLNAEMVIEKYRAEKLEYWAIPAGKKIGTYAN
jgi:hypothetical protein